jgi:hypothetical protein
MDVQPRIHLQSAQQTRQAGAPAEASNVQGPQLHGKRLSIMGLMASSSSASLSADQHAASEALAADLRRIFGARLRSLVAYGLMETSARDHDGLLRTLAILEQYSFDDLRQCAPHTDAWRRRGLAVPLLLTDHEFMRTLDVFPLEYGNIIASHVVITGDEPFANAHVSAADRRRGCEHQAKSHLVHLREGFLETGGDARDVAALIAASAPAFRSLLLNLAQLDLDRPNAAVLHDHELAAVTEQTIGVPGVLVTEILTSPATLGTVADPMALLSRYIDASERIWAFVDRLRS